MPQSFRVATFTREQAVELGGTVNLMTTYTVLTPRPERSLTVRETREIRHNGAVAANPTTEFARQAGTFTSAMPITVPRTAGAGTYDVTITVALGDRLSRGTTTFVVQ